MSISFCKKQHVTSKVTLEANEYVNSPFYKIAMNLMIKLLTRCCIYSNAVEYVNIIVHLYALQHLSSILTHSKFPLL